MARPYHVLGACDMGSSTRRHPWNELADVASKQVAADHTFSATRHVVVMEPPARLVLLC